MIDNLLAKGLILQTTGDYPVLKLQPESREVLFGGREVHVLKTKKLAGKRRKAPAAATAGPYNEELFDQLRDLRKVLATEQGVPPYVIFTDRTLHEMARRNPAGGGKAGGLARFFPARHIGRSPLGGPATVDDLLQITGVGQAKLEKYGRQFFEAIREFWEEHPATEDESHPDAKPLASIPAQPDLEPTASQPAHTPTYVEEARQKHARAYAKWSDEEDESLRHAWTGLADSPESDAAKIRTIADDFDRKPGAIRSRLKKLELLESADDVDLRTK
jgi:ATP-dependent DNA helicase RecQ